MLIKNSYANQAKMLSPLSGHRMCLKENHFEIRVWCLATFDIIIIFGY